MLLPISRVVDHEGFINFRPGLDHKIEFAGSHPHTSAIQSGIGPAINDALTIGAADLDPIAVPPNSRIMIEVAGLKAAPVRVIPKEDRQARERRRNYQFTDRIGDGPSTFVPTLNFRD